MDLLDYDHELMEECTVIATLSSLAEGHDSSAGRVAKPVNNYVIINRLLTAASDKCRPFYQTYQYSV